MTQWNYALHHNDDYKLRQILNDKNGAELFDLSRILKGLIVFQIADIIFEYIGRRLAFLLMSSLWDSPENVEYAMKCAYREAPAYSPYTPNKTKPRLRYWRPIMRVALLTHEITAWIFRHLENIKIAQNATVAFRRKIVLAKMSLLEADDGVDAEMVNGGTGGLWSHGEWRATKELLHREYAEAWTFFYHVLTDMKDPIQDFLKDWDLPCSFRYDAGSGRRRLIYSLIEETILSRDKFPFPQTAYERVQRLDLPFVMTKRNRCNSCNPCPAESAYMDEIEFYMSSFLHSKLFDAKSFYADAHEDEDARTQRLREVIEAEAEADSFRRAHPRVIIESTPTPPAECVYETEEDDPWDADDRAWAEALQGQQPEDDPGEVLAQSPTIDPLIIDLTEDDDEPAKPSHMLYRMDGL